MTAPAEIGTQSDALVQAAPRLGLVEHSADRLARLAHDYDGLEFLRAIRDGALPAAPIADLLGFAPREVEPGHVTFVLEPSPEHYNPIGSVHGGVIATMLDTVMGCALHSTLPKGSGYTTLDISIRYTRPVTVQTGPVTAIGELVHKGRRTATSEARLVDELGRVLATGTSTLLILG
jgi:uncharacterized protein (TIGR00369 family)